MVSGRLILFVLLLLSPTVDGFPDYLTSFSVPVLALLAFSEASIEVVSLTVNEVVAVN